MAYNKGDIAVIWSIFGLSAIYIAAILFFT